MVGIRALSVTRHTFLAVELNNEEARKPLDYPDVKLREVRDGRMARILRQVRAVVVDRGPGLRSVGFGSLLDVDLDRLGATRPCRRTSTPACLPLATLGSAGPSI